MSRSGTIICGVCQCLFSDSSCIHFAGRGTTDDPWVPEFNLDEDEDNLFRNSTNGLGAYLQQIYRDPPAVSLYSRAETTIPYNAGWTLFWDEEDYDTDNMYEPGDNSARIQINTPGLYVITLNLRFEKTGDNTATGDFVGSIRANGHSNLAYDSFPTPGGGTYPHMSLSAVWPLEAGDYVEARVRQDIVIADEPRTSKIMARWEPPTFAATLLRPLAGMAIPGYPSSQGP